MKKNKFYLFVFFALLPLLWAGCSQETNIIEPHGPQAGGKGEYPVSFTLKGVTAGPKTYAFVEAEEAERRISNLSVLLFDNATDKYVTTLAATVTGQSGQNETETDSKLTGTFDLGKDYGAEGKTVKFLLVANVTQADLVAGISKLAADKSVAVTDLDLADIKKLPIKQSPSEDNHFAMLNMGAELLSVTVRRNVETALSAPVVLRRLSARIDVKVGTAQKDAGLAVHSVTVIKRQEHSFLAEKGGETEALKTEETTKEYNSPLPRSFYTYENHEHANTQLSVVLSLNGVPLKPVSVPFTNKAIERNHIYSVTFSRDANDPVTPGDPSLNPPKITFKIDVNDWETDYLYNPDYANTDAPYVVKLTGMKSDWSGPLASQVHTVNTGFTEVSVPRNGYNLLAEVHGKSTQSEAVIITAGADWVSVSDITTYAPGMRQQFRIAVGIYAEIGTRKATIEFRNKLDASKKHTMTITQIGRPKMALEYVAVRNMAQDGTSFALSDKNDASGYFNWNDAVAKFTNINIAGEAYHLPSREEWRGIFPYYSGGPYVNYGSNDSYNNNPEQITVNGVSKTYFDDYRNNKALGVTYALRFKKATTGGTSEFPVATDNEMLCAFRYQRVGSFTNDGNLDSHLKVTCRYLGTTFSGDVTTIAKEDFWTTNNGEDVTRIFPSAGWKDSSGTLHYRGYFANYWSATEYSSRDAFYVYSGSSSAYSSSIGHIKTTRFTVRPFSDN